MEAKFCIRDISGTLMMRDTEIVDFCISSMQLKYVNLKTNGTGLPWALSSFGYGLTYVGFNEFFNNRVVRENAQDIRSYLDVMGLRHYDFEELVKRMNGWDGVGLHWVRFESIGARCFSDIMSQRYPIYGGSNAN